MNALTKLKSLAQVIIKNPKLLEIVNEFLDHPEFVTAPGGSTHHHAYAGGLAEHTWEVADQVSVFTQGNQCAVAAAIMHDFAKIYEYKIIDGKIVKTQFANLTGHVVWSWYRFKRAAEEHQLDFATTDEISHAMLAHHGRREWGSPVEPQTPIAFALHSADMLSMQAGKEAMKK